MLRVGMDDYSALAYRIAGGVADVRGCLILSRDGLILGSYPDDETAVKPAWVKFASLGEPERSFVEFGDQVWVFVRRPAYGAFAVADAGVRPGLVIDQLEQMLLSAEEARSRRETLRVPEASGAPSGKPRTSLHPTPERVEPATSGSPSASGASTVAGGESTAAAPRPWARGDSLLKRSGEEPAPASSTAFAELSADVPQAGDASEANGSSGSPAEPPEGGSAGGDGTTDGPAKADAAGGSDDRADETGKKARKKGDKDKEEPSDAERPAANGAAGSSGPISMELDADAVVDPVLLAKEFSGLLQVESGDDEGSS